MKSWPSLARFGKHILLPGGKLFYYEINGGASGIQGAGKPALVLIHGLGDEADTWRGLAPLLGDAGFRVLAPDLPGFGRSLWKGGISLEGHARAVLALLRETNAAGQGNQAVFIGSSMGAIIAQTIARRQPEIAQALVMLDGCFPLGGEQDKKLLLLGLPFIGKRWYRGFRKNHEALWRSLYPYYADLDAMSEEDRAFLRERVIARVESANQERGYFASLRSLLYLGISGKGNFSRSVKTYPGKILLLWGGADRIIRFEQSAPFRGLCPAAQFKIIAGSGHLPQQERPLDTAKAILEFLGDC